MPPDLAPRSDALDHSLPELEALLLRHVVATIQVPHDHRVHKDVHCAVCHLVKRAQQILPDARHREWGAAVRAVEARGNPDVLPLAPHAADGRPRWRGGAISPQRRGGREQRHVPTKGASLPFWQVPCGRLGVP